MHVKREFMCTAKHASKLITLHHFEPHSLPPWIAKFRKVGFTHGVTVASVQAGACAPVMSWDRVAMLAFFGFSGIGTSAQFRL
jgi:hypothetical protein